ncbi:hypothetical protein [Streptomyces sp. NRRL S-378]|uniref:hypothetical protein n=1 Tax=Streptomyces sp. NRRL S-378 TaxID=1463904 RepID=UPI0004C5A3D6|nr:hypothetical protein [Streptomyces sp. NRRL S-378]
MAAAEEQLPHGLVFHWSSGTPKRGGCRSRRCSAGPPPALAAREGLAVGLPAYFVAFDVLQLDGQELLTRPYEERRTLLLIVSE